MSVADLGAPARHHFPPPAKPAAFGGDADLRELLKRCSPVTYDAACRLRATGDPGHLPVVVRGIVERFVAPSLRTRLRLPGDELRLVEDLGVDSLTLLEIVSLAEEVFGISVDNEDLVRLRTISDVVRFIEPRIRPLPRPAPSRSTTPA